MSDVMFNFEASVFSNEHKSYYSQQDIKILHGFSTVANVGAILPPTEQGGHGRNRHLQGINRRLRQDQEHPNLQRVRPLQALQTRRNKELQPLHRKGSQPKHDVP